MDEAKDGLQYVTTRERELCGKYGHLLTNTGGNDPLELLDDLNDPTYKNFASTNLPRFVLAASVSAQIGLLMRLERDGRL